MRECIRNGHAILPSHVDYSARKIKPKAKKLSPKTPAAPQDKIEANSHHLRSTLYHIIEEIPSLLRTFHTFQIPRGPAGWQIDLGTHPRPGRG